LVCEALMIAFGMVVRHEVGDRMPKRGVSEEDHSVHMLATTNYQFEYAN